MINPKTFKKLEIMLFDGKNEEKEKALQELLKINTIESHSIIKKALREGDEELQYYIKKKFSSIIHKDNFKEKIKKTVKEKNKNLNLKNLKKYLTNEDSRKRLRAVEVAASSGDIKALPLLLDLAETEKDDFVKATIAKNLGLFKDNSLIPVISKYLNDPDARVRANAIEGLELIEDEGVIEYITPMLRDSNNRVQANAAKLLAKFDIGEVLDVFEKMLKSNAVWQRESALFGLKSIKNVETIPLITEIIKNDNNEAIRIEALKVLDIFSESVKKEKYKELRENSNVSKNVILMEMINKKLNISTNNVDQDIEKEFYIPKGLKIAILAFFCIFTLFAAAGGYHFYSVKQKIEKNENNKIFTDNKVKKNFNKNLSEMDNNKTQKEEENISNKIDHNKERIKTENKDLIDIIDINEDSFSPKPVDNNSKSDLNEFYIAKADINRDNNNHIDTEIKENKKNEEKELNKNSLLKTENINSSGDDELVNENNNIHNTKIDMISKEIIPQETREVISEDIQNNQKEKKDEIKTNESSESLSIEKLNSMLQKIEDLKQDVNKEDKELEALKDVKKEIKEKNEIIPLEQFKKDKIKRIILLPAQISSVNQVFNIFSNGYMVSANHILEPVGKEISFVDYFSVWDYLKRNNLSPINVKESKRQQDRILNELNGDFIIFSTIKESGSYFQEYWDNYINSNQISNIEKELTDNTFLMAKMDPSVDIEDIDFFEDNNVQEREEIAFPFYQKGVELYNKKQYKESYQEFKIAKAIAPDSKRFNIDNHINKAKNSFILALNRREDDLLNRIRISLTCDMINSSGKSVWNFKSNQNAEDYTDIFMSMFGSFKNYFSSNGVLYSDFDSINGHSKDFKSIIYFYRGLEYLLKENNDIDERTDNSKNITLRHQKAMVEFNIAEGLASDFSLVYILKSHINFLENKQIEGLNNLRTAVEKEPQRLSLQYKIAMYQEQLGNREESYKIFDKISSYQNSTVYDNVRILSLVKIIKKDILKKDFTKVLNRVEYGMKIKKSDELMFLKVYSLYNLKLYNKANDNVSLLTKLYPHDIIVSYMYANIMFELNSKQIAIKEYKKVLEDYNNIKSSKFFDEEIVNISKSEVFLKIGILYKSINNKSLAESYFKQTIAISPYSDFARKARDYMADL